MMHTKDLFQRVLIDPAKSGGRRLYIVSGYASPAMVFHHVDALRQKKINVEVELIVGMCAQEGLGQSHHLGFKNLMESSLKDSFKCSYLTKPPPVHAKVYAWFTNGNPVAGFVGSANYTQAGFRGGYREALAPSDPAECLAYFNSLIPETIYSDHMDAEQEIVIYNDKMFDHRRRAGKIKEYMRGEAEEGRPAIVGLPHVRVSFLESGGDLPMRSGLNWGQRPEEDREPNQAYIRLPVEIYSTDFFPPRGEHFTVLTDDRKCGFQSKPTTRSN